MMDCGSWIMKEPPTPGRNEAVRPNFYNLRYKNLCGTAVQPYRGVGISSPEHKIY